MALVNLAKFATFAFLICTMVSTFGSGAEMVIKEVVRNIDEKCSKNGEMCVPENDINCCEGLICIGFPIWPPRPGWCVGPTPEIKVLTKQPLCAHKGQSCFPERGLICCEGLLCKRPYVVPGTCLEA